MRRTAHPAAAKRQEAEATSRHQAYLSGGDRLRDSLQDILSLALTLFDAPVGMIAMAEASSYRVLAGTGTDLTTFPRTGSRCDAAIAAGRALVLADASKDPRFCGNACLELHPELNFFAGTPLIAPDGYVIGVLCVNDRPSRPGVSDHTLSAFAALGRLATDRLELARKERILRQAEIKARWAERQAQQARRRLQDALDIMPGAVLFCDPDDKVVLWNQAFEELYPESEGLLTPGTSFEEATRRCVESGLHQEEIDDPEVWLRQRLAHHRAPHANFEQRLKDGRWMRYDENRISDGSTVSVRIDITDLKRRQETFRALYDSNPVPMVVVDAQTLRFLSANDAARSHYGLDQQNFLKMRLPDLHVADEALAIERAFLRSPGTGSPAAYDGETLWRHKCADGAEIEVMPVCQCISYEGVDARLVTVIDVTEQKRNEARILHLAHHDDLTGLPNRGQFETRLKRAFEHARSNAGCVGLFMIDVDHFKEINDTLGHAAGDAVLRETARRLRQAVGGSACVARLGGDEFAIVVTTESTQAATALGKRIARIDAQPVTTEDCSINLRISVGIAVSPKHGITPEELAQNADIALYQSKNNGRRRTTVFDQSMREIMQRRIDLCSVLGGALERGEIVPHYQPIISLATGRICSFEALARWAHPELGLVSAGHFAEAFSNLELVSRLGDRMIDAVTSDIRRLRDEAGLRLPVAVNISAAELSRDGFAEDLLEILLSKGLSPRDLTLEATETIAIDHGNGTISRTLDALAQLGFRIALDDFGTGHASLIHLRKLKAAGLKIDMSFVRTMLDVPEDAEIVRSMVALGRNLNLSVVAEGVETEAQANALRACGCTQAQGFLFGKPIPAAHIPHAMRQSHERASRATHKALG
ncbi:sensor domain-containing phosphodiesterase [Stappia indica]|uniref:sensor domain-containing phosphodiesterase n=1 Tax=Stappia indica TaxID=538381 RepID=UPI001CD75015|nr:EAL domain-containing protein [Stappia indica]MCA1299008.1 EAL domain-containing protein [Stappia indica]